MSLKPNDVAFVRVFRGLTDDQLRQVLGVCEAAELGPHELLVKEGEKDRSMVILLEGVLDVTYGNPPTPLMRVTRGQTVGELALLGCVEQRSATVLTATDCAFLVMDVDGLDFLRSVNHPMVANLEAQVLTDLAGHIREIDQRIAEIAVGSELDAAPAEGLFARLAAAFGGPGARPGGSCPNAREVLRQSRAFSDLDEDLAQAFAARLEPVEAARGERVLHEGSMRGDTYIVASGEIGVFRATKSSTHEKLATLGPGALFGHVSMIDGLARTATCVAEKPAWLLRVPAELGGVLLSSKRPDAVVLRMGVIKALSAQLQTANRFLDDLTAAAHGAEGHLSSRLPSAQIDSVRAARAAITSA